MDKAVLKGEALGELVPLMRKKASCCDSQTRIDERGPRRLGPSDAESD